MKEPLLFSMNLEKKIGPCLGAEGEFGGEFLWGGK